LSRIRNAQRKLASSETAASSEALAAASGLTLRHTEEALRAAEVTCVPLEHLSGDSELQLVLRTERPVEETVLERLGEREVEALLCELTQRERLVLSLRLGLESEPPPTLEAIGMVLGVTRERVRQIETQALEQLRTLVAGGVLTTVA
jgi:RNA polymerase primary sigma factor